MLGKFFIFKQCHFHVLYHLYNIMITKQGKVKRRWKRNRIRRKYIFMRQLKLYLVFNENKLDISYCI